jgi:hypothetical protein
MNHYRVVAENKECKQQLSFLFVKKAKKVGGGGHTTAIRLIKNVATTTKNFLSPRSSTAVAVHLAPPYYTKLRITLRQNYYYMGEWGINSRGYYEESLLHIIL